MRARLVTAAALLLGGAIGCGVAHAGAVGPKVVYGVDNRRESTTMTGSAATNADATMALIWSWDMRDLGNGRSRLFSENLGTAYNLCPDQRFRDQPTAAHCSGVLVDRDLVVTAGHCVMPSDVTDLRFVFGYRVTGDKAQTTVLNTQIYKGKAVVARRYEAGGEDYAIVRLDRAVVGHARARLKSVGNIGAQRKVHVIGYPSGLPEKVADGARVYSSAKKYFTTNLDTFGGNSGSPVFDSVSHEVVGILVRGRLPDYRADAKRQCSVVATLPDGRPEEEAVHASIIAAKLPRQQSVTLLSGGKPR